MNIVIGTRKFLNWIQISVEHPNSSYCSSSFAWLTILRSVFIFFLRKKSIKLHCQTLPNLHQIISLLIPIKGSFIVLLLWSRLLSSNRFYGSFFTIKHYVRSGTHTHTPYTILKHIHDIWCIIVRLFGNSVARRQQHKKTDFNATIQNVSTL